MRERCLLLMFLLPLTAIGQSYLQPFSGSLRTEYFEFHYRTNQAHVAEIARFADSFVKTVNRDFFKADFDYPIQVLVLEDRARFQDFLRREFQIADPPGFGVYLYAYKLFATYEDSGLGTFTHEIMHPLVERNLKDRPVWAIEGIPTFFEKFYGYWTNGESVIQWGYQNPWRIQLLGTNLTRLDLQSLLTTTDPQGQFRESDLRMVSMFLWEQGQFPHFLQLIQKREKDGYNSYFEAALKMPVEKVLPLWQQYLNNVAANRSQIMRYPPSTIMNDEPAFERFAEFYKIPIKSPPKSGQ